MFVSVLVQASPFLVFGVVLSAVIAVFVPRSFWARALPRHPALAVPAAGLAGVVLPGCECGSVPIAGSLIRRGVTPAAALAFLLAAPAINPIVLTATAIAFPRNPEMVVGRGVASLVVAVVMGWLWLRLGKPSGSGCRTGPTTTSPSGRAFWAPAGTTSCTPAASWSSARGRRDHQRFGARRWLQSVAGNPAVSVLALAVLAVLLSICSEADAFVAASLSQFSLTARLVFLVGGPDGRPEADLHADRRVRPPVRVPVRPGHVRRSDPGRHRVRGGAAVNRRPRPRPRTSMLLLGGAILKASIGDLFLRYVKAGPAALP